MLESLAGNSASWIWKWIARRLTGSLPSVVGLPADGDDAPQAEASDQDGRQGGCQDRVDGDDGRIDKPPARHRGFGQVARDAAGAEIIGVHARARGALVEHHQLLAFLEAPERRRQRADVHRLRRDIEQMVQKTADFRIEHADILAALGHRQAQQFFDGHTVGVLVTHRRHVVQTIHVRHRLHPGTGLSQFFRGTVQQTNVRVGTFDSFTIQLQHQTQHTVCRRVLRAEVQCVVTNL